MDFVMARSGGGDPIFLILIAGGFAAYGAIVAGYYFSTVILGFLITPRKHASLRDMKATEAYRSLRNDGYGVTPDWRIDAIERLQKEKK